MRTKKRTNNARRTSKRRVQRGGGISTLQRDIFNYVSHSETKANAEEALEFINIRIEEINRIEEVFNDSIARMTITDYYNIIDKDDYENILLEKKLLEKEIITLNAKLKYYEEETELYKPKYSVPRKSSSPSRNSVGPPSSAESFSPQKALKNASAERKKTAFENARNVFKNK